MPLFTSRVLGLVLLAVPLLTGCGLSGFSAPSTATSLLPSIAGTIHGGQQPVSNALIQLYASNSVVLQGASTPLLSKAVYSDASGGFNLTGAYTCPAPGSLVYLVATGGNPGLASTVNNAGIAMMTVLGTCGTLTSATFISVNELTTVAAVEALAPFMLDYAHVGSASASGLSIAFTNAVANVSPATGQLLPITGPVPATSLLYTLADILAACINSTGGTVGSSSSCGTLFQNTTATTGNTIASLLSIVRNPTSNVPALFKLVSASSPFQPALSAAPTNFAFYISASIGPGAPVSVLNPNYLDQLFSDSQGHLWLVQPELGLLTQYDTSLNVLHSYNLMTTLAYPGTLDPKGNLWAEPSSAMFEEIGSDGAIKSPAGGYIAQTTGLGGAISGIKADSAGNIWATVIRADGAICAVEYSPTFALLSPATGYCSTYTYGSQSGQVTSAILAADANGNVFQLNVASGPNVVVKYTAGGSISTFATTVGIPGAITYDTVLNRLITISNDFLTSYQSNGSVAFAINLQTSNNFTLSTTLNSLTTDGAGNLWLATVAGSLAQISPDGLVLSACNLTCGVPVDVNIGSLASIAIDPAGDIFVVDIFTGTLLKFPGLAASR